MFISNKCEEHCMFLFAPVTVCLYDLNLPHVQTCNRFGYSMCVCAVYSDACCGFSMRSCCKLTVDPEHLGLTSCHNQITFIISCYESNNCGSGHISGQLIVHTPLDKTHYRASVLCHHCRLTSSADDRSCTES